MNETVDLRNYEQGVEELMKKLQFPPMAPNGEQMPDMQKRMMILQFIQIALMN